MEGTDGRVNLEAAVIALTLQTNLGSSPQESKAKQAVSQCLVILHGRYGCSRQPSKGLRSEHSFTAMHDEEQLMQIIIGRSAVKFRVSHKCLLCKWRELAALACPEGDGTTRWRKGMATTELRTLVTYRS